MSQKHFIQSPPMPELSKKVPEKAIPFGYWAHISQLLWRLVFRERRKLGLSGYMVKRSLLNYSCNRTHWSWWRLFPLVICCKSSWSQENYFCLSLWANLRWRLYQEL
ncbi:unnamed protein product [Blepharisma stoltei]|uniref:Uncharacterized protein n=1 Tax=Blepharisma stoltei TaxID=1481888 RepID=A0AAU9JEN1_9CILI|nr:unnamed protein product [Blepharisma stoltei]